MTSEEFRNTRWRSRMFATYKGEKYPIAGVDFEEELISLDGVVLGADYSSWVRYENVDLIGEQSK